MPVSIIDRSMLDSPEIRALGRALDVNATRSELITSNLANIDTPGYHSRDINFAQEMERAVRDPVFEYASFTPAVRAVEGLASRPDGNNVSLEREGLLLAQTQLRFQTAVEVLKSEFHRIRTAISEGGQP
jgi:flagellar basal-body rod protein FlgB